MGQGSRLGVRGWRVLKRARGLALILLAALLLNPLGIAGGGRARAVSHAQDTNLSVAETPLPAWTGTLPYSIPDVPGAPPLATIGLSPLNEPPGPADLAESTEVKLTPDIVALAASLNNDPQTIFNYVRNNIEYEPIYGSFQDATHTLQVKAGNDIAQASLLIALLRAAGVPARYVFGQISLPEEKVLKWLRVENRAAAVKRLQYGGIPFYLDYVNLAGQTVALYTLDHVWVEAFLSQAGLETWVQLDPSYKLHDRKQGINLDAVIGLDVNQYLNDLQQGATIGPNYDYLTNLNVTNHEQVVTQAEARLDQYLREQMPGARPIDVVGGWEIAQEDVTDLANALQYRVGSLYGEAREVPDPLRVKVRFQVGGIDKTVALAEILGRRLSVFYPGATPADQQTIDNNGGVYGLPANSVSVVPQLSLEGQALASGSPITLGQHQQLLISLSTPYGWSDTVEKWLTSGGSYALAVAGQRVAEGLIQKRSAALQELILANTRQAVVYADEFDTVTDTVVDGKAAGSEAILGESLYLLAMQYIYQNDVVHEIAKGILQVASTRHYAIGFAEQDPQVMVDGAGVPQYLEEGRVVIDVPRFLVAPVSSTGDAETEKRYMLTTGFQASAFEGGIMEQVTFRKSVSTIKVLSLANSQGVTIHRITSSNLGQVLPILQLTDSTKQQITQAVQQGYEVIIPEREIQYHQWQGIGYIVLNPATGGAGYMISGGLAGGSTASIGEVAVKWFSDRINKSLQSSILMSTVAVDAGKLIVRSRFGIAVLALAEAPVWLLLLAVAGAIILNDAIDGFVSWVIEKVAAMLGLTLVEDVYGRTIVIPQDKREKIETKHTEITIWDVETALRERSGAKLEIWYGRESGLDKNLYIYKILNGTYAGNLIYVIVRNGALITAYIPGISFGINDLKCQWHYIGLQVKPNSQVPWHWYGKIPDAVPDPKPYTINKSHQADILVPLVKCW